MLPSIAIAQLNSTAGDIAGNMARIREARARVQNAELLVCPELAISGYPPEDLLLRPSFRAACMDAAEALAKETAQGPALLVGCPWEEAGNTYNAALLMDGGAITYIARKVQLPNYGIFDEKRVFTAGPPPSVALFRGRKLGVLVCEDLWFSDVPKLLAAEGAEALVVLNASPFERGKLAARHAIAAEAARGTGLPLLYVNRVGGQDDIVFDGGSFAMDRTGAITMQAPQCEETVIAGGEDAWRSSLDCFMLRPRNDEEEIWRAIALGLGDYVRKNGFSGVLIGLSGGIDSAVVATLAVDALGADKVMGVLLPSALTSRASIEDAEMLAHHLGIHAHSVSIQEMRAVAHLALEAIIPEAERNTLAVDGNMQARLRGLTLMALSNASGRMVVGTGNKSEIATGYTTLYGDAIGGYAPLKDVYKTEVYALAKWRNTQSALIPERCITKAPTAELAPNQKDEDQLPPYAVLDAILAQYIEQRKSVAEIAASGMDRALVEKVVRMVHGAEYKRRQMPPGPKVSPMLFGRDWRYPLTSGWRG